VTLDVVFLRAGRRRCGCPKDKNGSDDKTGNDKNGNDDGRPTLKRRPDDN